MFAKYNENGTKKLQNVRQNTNKIGVKKLGRIRIINKVRK